MKKIISLALLANIIFKISAQNTSVTDTTYEKNSSNYLVMVVTQKTPKEAVRKDGVTTSGYDVTEQRRSICPIPFGVEDLDNEALVLAIKNEKTMYSEPVGFKDRGISFLYAQGYARNVSYNKSGFFESYIEKDTNASLVLTVALLLLEFLILQGVYCLVTRKRISLEVGLLYGICVILAYIVFIAASVVKPVDLFNWRSWYNVPIIAMLGFYIFLLVKAKGNNFKKKTHS